ncbi:hypothetical protein [uncultured Bradyrhizobium sp.]|jgi:hypothetical protein|uniref:hypothetical protein n=1 Tax=uncultured Bradyrhizobium sp. TaxID=199684 RepID=UPI0026348482|nr:hypothetical protein [uncultured Bradyrhizobium sp.]
MTEMSLEEAKARVLRMYAPRDPVILMAVDTGAARRMRAKRAREALGIDLIHGVPVRNLFRLVDLLIDDGWLTESALDDQKALAEAVGKFLDFCVTRNSLSK